jgi:predicted MFS family arabinose efflux permease
VLFTLIGGVLADRLDRRRTLLTSQYIQMSTAFALAALVYFHLVSIWSILALSFITGTAQAFGGPAYQSLLPSLVDRKDMPNAIALNSIQFNIARVIGPLLAGAALAAFGMVSCFTLNGLSFLVVIFSLLSLNVRHIPPAAPKRMREELQTGLSYVRHEGCVLALILLAAATTFLGFPVLTFLPVFAQSVFHQGVDGYTRLMAFAGAGAVAGSLVVAWLGKFNRMGFTTLVVQLVFGALIIAFSLSRVIWLSYALLFLTNASLMVVFSTITSLVQMTAPNQMRGRVMSIYMLAFRGGMPLGSLAAGYLASRYSAPSVLLVNGVLMIGVAVYFLIRSHGVREI